MTLSYIFPRKKALLMRLDKKWKTKNVQIQSLGSYKANAKADLPCYRIVILMLLLIFSRCLGIKKSPHRECFFTLKGSGQKFQF